MIIKEIKKSIKIPSSNVTRCNNRFSWSSKQTSQIESLIASCLYIVTKLNNNDVCYRVTILKLNQLYHPNMFTE